VQALIRFTVTDSIYHLCLTVGPCPKPLPWSVTINGMHTPCCGTGNIILMQRQLAKLIQICFFSVDSRGGTITSVRILWILLSHGMLQHKASVKVRVTESACTIATLETTRTVTVFTQPAPLLQPGFSVCNDPVRQRIAHQTISGHNYNWTVVGGNIASGQGTNSIIVNWGSYPFMRMRISNSLWNQ